MARLGLRTIKKPNLAGSFGEETRNKPVINPEQTCNKPVTENSNKPVMESETYNKPVMESEKTRNKKVINPEQTRNKPVMEFSNLSVDSISGFQRKILEIIFSEIQINPYEKVTRNLNISQLGILLGITDSKGFESLRIIILRLEKSGFLIKSKIKNGRCGWTKYSLPNQVFDQLLKLRQIEKPVIKPEYDRNKPVTKPVMNGSSKLVSNINTNLLTSDESPVSTEISGTLDVSSIFIDQLLRFNVTRKQLQDIKNQNLNFTTATLQSFVDRFAIYASDSKNIANIKSMPAIFVKMAQLASNGQDPLVE